MNSLDLISDADFISVVIPEHSKNWLIVLFLYVIVLLPHSNVPLSSNPIVESTVITVEFLVVFSITLVFGVILKDPVIKDLSSYPTNKLIL